jgi:acyl dehydratase
MTEPVPVRTPDDVRGLLGRRLGPSSWIAVTQSQDDAFAEAAHDWHWAHNEPDVAARGPFGTAIVHAHLVLALVPRLLRDLVVYESGECMFYGYERVRIPQALPIGSRLRMTADVTQVDDVTGGLQVTTDLRLDVEGQERPACVARALWRFYEGVTAPPGDSG